MIISVQALPSYFFVEEIINQQTSEAVCSQHSSSNDPFILNQTCHSAAINTYCYEMTPQFTQSRSLSPHGGLRYDSRPRTPLTAASFTSLLTSCTPPNTLPLLGPRTVCSLCLECPSLRCLLDQPLPLSTPYLRVLYLSQPGTPNPIILLNILKYFSHSPILFYTPITIIIYIYVPFWYVSFRKTEIFVCVVHCHFPNIPNSFWYKIGA